jgi:hypothetical protein
MPGRVRRQDMSVVCRLAFPRLFALLAVAGCGSVTAPADPDGGAPDSGGPDSGSGDTTAPKVVSVTPTDGTTQVSVLLSSISIVFDEPLDPATIDGISVWANGTRWTGELTYDDATRTVRFTPARPLERNARHTVVVGAVTDLAGNLAEETRSSFFTYVGSPLEVLTYANGSVTHRQRYVLDTNGRWSDILEYADRGQDGTWQTPDDVASGRRGYVYRADGAELEERSYQGSGGDGTWGTPDDVIASVWTWTVDAEGRPQTAALATGPGSDSAWGTADDELNTRDVFTWQGDLKTGDVTYYQPGPDGMWRTADDVVLSYTSLQYDTEGRLQRRIDVTDPGADGMWQTADDPVGLYLGYTYDSDGHRAREVRYVDRGPDVQWFTADDVIGDALVYQHTPEGLETSLIAHIGSGADGIWFTTDDEVSTRLSSGYDARGLLTFQHYEMAGADGAFGTADDRVLRFVYTSDAMGRNVDVSGYDHPGADGIWGTSDDRLYQKGVYDTAH